MYVNRLRRVEASNNRKEGLSALTCHQEALGMKGRCYLGVIAIEQLELTDRNPNPNGDRSVVIF